MFSEKLISSWKGKHLSVGGRLVLINLVLYFLPMFMLFFFKIHKSVLKKLDYYLFRFFWQCDDHQKMYRLAKWSILSTPKCVGGLGITNLEFQNICLLSKWLFELLNEEGMWQTILKRKYLGNKVLSQVAKKPEDSQFWKGLMDIKGFFLPRG